MFQINLVNYVFLFFNQWDSKTMLSLRTLFDFSVITSLCLNMDKSVLLFLRFISHKLFGLLKFATRDLKDVFTSDIYFRCTRGALMRKKIASPLFYMNYPTSRSWTTQNLRMYDYLSVWMFMAGTITGNDYWKTDDDDYR